MLSKLKAALRENMRTRLLLTTALAVTFGMLVVAILPIVQMFLGLSSGVEDDAIRYNEVAFNQYQNISQSTAEQLQKTEIALTGSSQQPEGLDQQEIERILREMAEVDEQISDYVVMFEDDSGKAVSGQESVTAAQLGISGDIASEKLILPDPERAVLSDSYVLLLPLQDGDTLEALGAVLDRKTMTQQLRDSLGDDDVMLALLDAEGRIIGGERVREELGDQVGDLSHSYADSTDSPGIVEVDGTEQSWTASYQTDEASGVTVATFTDQQDVYSQIIATIRGTVPTAAIVAALVIAALWRPIGRTLAPVKESSEKLTQMAETGDLTERLPVDGEDEIAQLAQSFNSFARRVQSIVIDISEISQRLDSAGKTMVDTTERGLQHTETVSASAEKLRQAAERQTENTRDAASNTRQVSEGVEQVADGAQEQASSIEDAQNMVVDMMDEVEDNLQQLERTDELATRTSSQAEEGAEAIAEVNSAVGQLSQTAEQTNSTMSQLQEASEEIGRITEMIAEISSQTNLLALNAAIEAVRAGEAGKGFTVLAEEIRSLAERAEGATDEIADITDSMQESIAGAVQGTGESLEAISHTADSTQRADELIEDMSRAAGETRTATEQLQQSFRQLNEKMERVTSSMQSVSSVVQENTAATEEMAAGSQEVAAAMDQISAIAEETNDSAVDVSELADRQKEQMQQVSSSAERTATSAQQVAQLLDQFETGDSKADG